MKTAKLLFPILALSILLIACNQQTENTKPTSPSTKPEKAVLSLAFDNLPNGPCAIFYFNYEISFNDIVNVINSYGWGIGNQEQLEELISRDKFSDYFSKVANNSMPIVATRIPYRNMKNPHCESLYNFVGDSIYMTTSVYNNSDRVIRNESLSLTRAEKRDVWFLAYKK